MGNNTVTIHVRRTKGKTHIWNSVKVAYNSTIYKIISWEKKVIQSKPKHKEDT